jgi:TRAP-type C4-dicarboxylate transport system substrate-binding protein
MGFPKRKKGKMNKKIFGVVFSLLLILLAIPLPESGAQKPEPATKPMILKASIQTPAGMPFTQVLYWWLDEVEKRSGGRIKFERYPGESLAKAAEQVDALESGMADVSLFVTTYTPGKIPLNTITNMPFTFGQAWVNATTYLQWVRSMPELENEYTRLNIKVVSSYGTGPYFVLSTKPIRKMEDFKGKKIIVTGPAAEWVRAIRGAPLGIVITESYEALQRGTADGAIFGPSAAGSYHIEEVCKYLLKLPVTGACGPIGMHMGTWKRLPPDIQQMITDLAPEHAKALHKIYQIDGDGKFIEIFKKAGVEIIEPSPALMAEGSKIAKDVVWGKWANDQEARKLPGKKALEAYIKLLEKNQEVSPFK